MSRFFILTLLLSFAQPNLLSQSPGEVSPYLVCDINKEHAYALYLPSGYTPDKEWPALFLYSAGGNGMAGMEKFRPAAEKYGYILVGSHNYRNGPVDKGFEAARILLEEITKKYPVNMERIYTGGMSGGARMATTVAVVTNKIAGVIAIGASFNFLNKPNTKNSFAFVGIAGDKDMNYLELVKATEEVRELGIKSHLIAYDGKHRWCEEPQATEAIQWLELHAIQKGLSKNKNDFSSTFMIEQLERGKQLEKELRFTEAHSLYQSLKLFYGPEEVKEIDLRITVLEKEKAFKKQNRIYSSILEKESKRERDIRTGFNNIDMVMRSDSVYRWWQTQTTQWRKEQKNAKTLAARNSATRSLGFMGLFAFSTASPHISTGKWTEALPYLKVAALINPENADLNYFMAKIYALNKDQRLSKKHQKKATNASFKREDGSSEITQERLMNVKEFDWLRWRVINALF
ncbi:MAG: hypothetical protein HEP71_29905 [Roseivirga sp.]|nr:hypothetical protein [Roseivirga sp.]